MTTTEQPTAHQFLRDALNNSYAVWVAFGNEEIEGYVLTCSKRIVEIQDREAGGIRQVAIAAITEAVEC
jgi:hypothetical protein